MADKRRGGMSALKKNQLKKDQAAAHCRLAPTVRIVPQEETVDIRAWARVYVNVLLTLEGIAQVPVVLPRAS